MMKEKENPIADVLPSDYQFNLSDFALFLSVMKNKKAYENVLSIILNEEDLNLVDVKVEQVILNKSGRRAIRLDAWAVDTKNRQFNTEMQNDAAHDDLRKRSRFYQGMLDTPILKAGRQTKYKNLPSTVIIFITQEDIFGKDLARYTFTEQCEEVPRSAVRRWNNKDFPEHEEQKWQAGANQPATVYEAFHHGQPGDCSEGSQNRQPGKNRGGSKTIGRMGGCEDEYS